MCTAFALAIAKCSTAADSRGALQFSAAPPVCSLAPSRRHLLELFCAGLYRFHNPGEVLPAEGQAPQFGRREAVFVALPVPLHCSPLVNLWKPLGVVSVDL
jgi:hypothetical protein